MVCEPPVSLPYTVIVVCIVDVRLGFGINLNVLPVTTAAVVVTSSPKNIGAVPVAVVVPLPIILPAYLFANIKHYFPLFQL